MVTKCQKYLNLWIKTWHGKKRIEMLPRTLSRVEASMPHEIFKINFGLGFSFGILMTWKLNRTMEPNAHTHKKRIALIIWLERALVFSRAQDMRC